MWRDYLRDGLNADPEALEEGQVFVRSNLSLEKRIFLHIAGLIQEHSGFDLPVEAIAQVDDDTIGNLLISFFNGAYRSELHSRHLSIVGYSQSQSQPGLKNAKELQNKFWEFVEQKNAFSYAKNSQTHQSLKGFLPIAIIFIRQLIAVIKSKSTSHGPINLSNKTNIYDVVLVLYEAAIERNDNIASWPAMVDIQQGGSKEVSIDDAPYFIVNPLNQITFNAILQFNYDLTKVPPSIWQQPAVLASVGSLLGMTMTGVAAVIHQGNIDYEESASAIVHPPRSWFYQQALRNPEVIGLILGVGLGIFLILSMLLYGKRWLNRRTTSAAIPLLPLHVGTEREPLLGQPPRMSLSSSSPLAAAPSAVASSAAAPAANRQLSMDEQMAALDRFQQACVIQHSVIAALSAAITILKKFARIANIMDISADLQPNFAILGNIDFAAMDFCSEFLLVSTFMREYLDEKINHPRVAPSNPYNLKLINQFLAAYFYVELKKAMQKLPGFVMSNGQVWLSIGFLIMKDVDSPRERASFFNNSLKTILASYYLFHYLVTDIQEKAQEYHDSIISISGQELQMLSRNYFLGRNIFAVKEELSTNLARGSIVEEGNQWRLQ